MEGGGPSERKKCHNFFWSEEGQRLQKLKQPKKWILSLEAKKEFYPVNTFT